MATVGEVPFPKKRITTYGKAAKRRVPDFRLTTAAKVISRPQTPERTQSVPVSPSPLRSISGASAESKRGRPAQQRSAMTANSPAKDIYKVSSEEELSPPRSQVPIVSAKPKKSKTTLRKSTPPVVSPAKDVWDVPSEDEVATPKPKTRVAPRKPITKSKKEAELPVDDAHERSSSDELGTTKVRAPIQKPATKSTRPAELLAKDVWDVSSGDDEPLAPKARTPLRRPLPKPVPQKLQKLAPSEASVAVPTVANNRKRVKMSPAPTSQSSSVVEIFPQRSILSTSSIAAKMPLRTVKAGHTMTMASRPKLVPRISSRARTTQKIASPPNQVLSTRSTPEAILEDAMDIDVPPSGYVSPRSLQTWNDVFAQLPDEMDGVKGELSTESPGASSMRAGGRMLFKAAGVSKPMQRGPKDLPRRRLIDSLVEQAQSDDDMDEDEAEDSEGLSTKTMNVTNFEKPILSREQSVVPEVPLSEPASQGPAAQGSQTTGPKFTYAKQRSILEEKDLEKALSVALPAPSLEQQGGRRRRRMSIPKLNPLPSFHNAEEEAAGVAAISSVHELRKSGANSQFTMEMDDMFQRIDVPVSPPSSSRRSALLELATSMNNKGFLRQFRAGTFEEKLFVHLGRETDLLSGYLLISILAVILADSSMPHMVTQLRRQGITRLLVRLLDCEDSIVAFVGQRKSNMSKMAQGRVRDYDKALVSSVTWEDLDPQAVPPRTISLKCLELMVQQTRETGNENEMISKELTTKLFQILSTASEERSWELPQGQHAIDFYLALSVLRNHSVAARTAQNESIWISEFLPIIADVLIIALQRPKEDFGTIQTSIMKLTLNVTGKNTKASEVFASQSVMVALGQVIVTKFKKMLSFVTEDELPNVLEHIILAEAVMTNLVHRSAAARECFHELQGTEEDPLEHMVRIFVDNAAKTSEADSFEETQKNVSFGYLAVLLGSLCLLPELLRRIVALHPRKSLRPFVTVIDEFAGYLKFVDDMAEGEADTQMAHREFTGRVESISQQLKALKVTTK